MLTRTAEGASATRPRSFVSIEILRGLAAVGVLLFHSEVVTAALHPQSVFASLFNLFFAGVDLFFVLSGFLMVWVHARDFDRPARLPLYLAKRALRMYPVYWVLCCALVPLTLTLPAFRHDGASLSGGEIVASVLLLPHHGTRLLGVTWTLEYELLFYIAFSIFFVSRRAGVAIFSLWCVAVLAAAAWGPPPGLPTGALQFGAFLPGFLLNLHLVEFFAGMAMAALLHRGIRVGWPGILLGLGAMTVVAVVLVTWMQGTHALGLEQGRRIVTLGAGLLAVLLLFAALQYELRHTITAPAWLRTIGAASYSIYLTHFLVIALFAVLAKRAAVIYAIPASALMLIMLAAGLAPGILLHILVEAPLLRWTSRRLADRRWENPAAR